MLLNQRIIYLDNSTASRPSGEAISKMLPFYAEKWGAPTQPHLIGQAVVQPIKEALKQIYGLLGASLEDAVILTSSSSEAITHAFFATYEELALKEGRNHFIGSTIDEAASLVCLEKMERMGCPVTRLKPGSSGSISPAAIVDAVTPRTALVTLSMGNGLTGVVQQVKEIAEICSLRGIRLLLDATHVLGKLFFDLKEVQASYIAFNGPQIQGPEGTGGLFIRKGVKTGPLISGGLEQAGLRGGSLNVPGMIGLGASAKIALEARDYMCTEIARMRFHFENELLKRISFAKVLFHDEERLPHISAIAFPGVVNEALLYLLNRKGVCAGIGGGSFVQIGYLLEQCGMDPLLANSAISFSFSKETTEEELDVAVELIAACANKLFKTSQELFNGL